MQFLGRKSVLIIVLVLFVCVSGSVAQTTGFKYQGSLSDGGEPATGSFQMQFRLFDAPAGGSQIGPTLSDLPVTANAGIFSITLDFGANVFTGGGRWLEISVRRNTGEPYTLLSPREEISSSPYSVKTLSATQADGLSPSCVGCVQNSHISSVSGAKVTGPVANATNAVSFAGPLAGDVTGSQGSTTVAAIQNRAVANTPPASGQVLKFNGTQWAPGTDSTGTGGEGGTITGVTAGTGLTGGGTTGSVTVGIANGGVGTTQLADGSVTDAKVTSISGAKVAGAVANATNAVNSTNAANAVNATNAASATNFTGPLGGDVTGTQGATNVTKLRDVTLPAPVVADNGKVLKYKNNGVDPITYEWAVDNTSSGGGAGVSSVTATGPLASSGGATPNISLTGTIAPANGGTGITSTGAAGNFLRSNGTAWTSSALAVPDIPDLGATYLRNSTQPQTGNLNISGNGLFAGSVGIGTATPNAKLEVRGADIQQRITDNGSGNSLVLQGGPGSNMKVTGYNYTTGTGVPLYLSTDGANTILNSGGGNVGIGGAPSGFYRLEAAGPVRSLSPVSTHLVAETTGSTNAWARLYLRTANTNGTLHRSYFMGTSRSFNGDQFYIGDETAGGAIRMAIMPNGFVGIGTGNPNAALEVGGAGIQQRITDSTSGNSLVLQGGAGSNMKVTGYNYGTGQPVPLHLSPDGASTVVGGNMDVNGFLKVKVVANFTDVPSSECSQQSHWGRMFVATSNSQVYPYFFVCFRGGWTAVYPQ